MKKQSKGSLSARKREKIDPETGLTPSELKREYAKAKRELTPERLAEYARVEPGVPAEQVLAECEETVRQVKQLMRKGRG
jgi:hypothetical protein